MTVKDEEDPFILESAVVTGTRIRGGETVGATVVGIDREEIEYAAGVAVDQSFNY